MLFKAFNQFVRDWAHDQRGLAATEFALVFPILIMLLLATIELGNGIMANQKVIMASQIVSDLLTRTEEVTDEQLEEAKRAGRLALNPFNPEDVGFDIVSISFEPEDSTSDPDDAVPEVVWRETDNMDGQELDEADIIENVTPLVLIHDGLFAVYVRYPYRPLFGTRFVGSLNMIEYTFARGRKNPVVGRNES